MKIIQIATGVSALLFMAKVFLSKTIEGQSNAFLAVIILFTIFIWASHCVGMARIDNDIADEIKKNHFDNLNKRKRNRNVDDVQA